MAEQNKTSEAPRPAVQATQQGALMHNTYLQRRQEFVSVNKTDLEDIRDFDWSERKFSGMGLFFLSGGLWLGAEKTLESYELSGGFEMSSTLWLCVICVAVGGFLVLQGITMASKKTDRIQRIFDETEEIEPGNIVANSSRGSKGGENRGIRG